MKVILFFLFLTISNGHCTVFKYDFIEISSKLNFDKYSFIEATDYESVEIKTFKSNDNNFIKIRQQDLKGKSKEEMLKVMKKSITQYTLLFEERPSPYTGAFTVKTECENRDSTKHKIISSSDMVSTSFETVATEKFIYGKCNGKSIDYFSKYFLVLCLKKFKFYDVRLFNKKNQDLSQVEVKCAK